MENAVSHERRKELLLQFLDRKVLLLLGFFSGNMLFHLKKIASLTSKARAETEEALTATQQDRGSLYRAKRTILNACYKYLN